MLFELLLVKEDFIIGGIYIRQPVFGIVFVAVVKLGAISFQL
ncbi:MAG TPA: hypothetical protein VL098_09725 [Flavipsychrobacter sp.]|nr:hypothetical protein [Agriterribacter sp.]HTN08246.1 hypothetical protein [Agriterribacter sp.]HTN46612.1 hypothetical protein [Flavipsychrobacter sp.]